MGMRNFFQSHQPPLVLSILSGSQTSWQSQIFRKIFLIRKIRNVGANLTSTGRIFQRLGATAEKILLDPPPQLKFFGRWDAKQASSGGVSETDQSTQRPDGCSDILASCHKGHCDVTIKGIMILTLLYNFCCVPSLLMAISFILAAVKKRENL